MRTIAAQGIIGGIIPTPTATPKRINPNAVRAPENFIGNAGVIADTASKLWLHNNEIEYDALVGEIQKYILNEVAKRAEGAQLSAEKRRSLMRPITMRAYRTIRFTWIGGLLFALIATLYFVLEKQWGNAIMTVMAGIALIIGLHYLSTIPRIPINKSASTLF